ncbi:MAG: GGDEF domain-containing protein [Fibrobacter sp.]|nr:GGDEF domain-containing protein [Fibrobacter sp.]
MDSTLSCIYVVNIFGAVLLAVVAAGNVWKLPRKNLENTSLLVMLILGFLNCLIDPIVFTSEGRPGALAKFINIYGNGWLYGSNMYCSTLWFVFLSQHICGGVSRIHAKILKTVVGLGTLGVLINFFCPFIFSIDGNNHYHRMWGYWIYTVIDYGITMDSIVVYFWSRRRNGILKYFPIWVYFFPLMIGTFAQTLFYGISTISAGLAVSIAGIFSSLQNELIFRDRLTGLYNRVYLDRHMNVFSRKRRTVMTGLMLDLNSFKKINDDFGHSVGDRALIAMADILQRTIHDEGVAIRYAGDEFIVLLNTADQEKADSLIREIHYRIEKFNNNSKAPFKLSTSIGKGLLDLKKGTMDEFINTIDREMYENKKAYYAVHSENDRRLR